MTFFFECEASYSVLEYSKKVFQKGVVSRNEMRGLAKVEQETTK